MVHRFVGINNRFRSTTLQDAGLRSGKVRMGRFLLSELQAANIRLETVYTNPIRILLSLFEAF